MAKKRLDLVLVEQGLAANRTQARGAIMAGRVLVDGQVADKAGTLVDDGATLSIRGQDMPFVSRGGVKLAHGLDLFQIDLTDRIVLDAGASTGGFTHCALENGARLVYAVDVGYGQLAWQLRSDSRVVNMERTNVRHLTRQHLQQGLPDFCSVDLAFISLAIVLPVLSQLLVEPGEMVLLVKPQFEAGKSLVGKGGVVREEAVHRQVLHNVLAAATKEGLHPYNLAWSPIRGPKGNIEFLLHAGLSPGEATFDVETVVAAAHSQFSSATS